MHRDLPGLIRQAAGVLARSLGVSADDTVFVENATAGCNAVLRSHPLRDGDEILVFDQAYGAVRNIVRHVAALSGAVPVEIELPFPDCPPDEVVHRLAAAITGRTVLAVLDHVTSPGALVLPLAAMTAACRERGVAVLVDGAHAPGQLPLALDALGADWYAGNLHKWLFAPAGSGFLHARRDRQAGLHPTAISHGLGQGFLAEFDWTGTRDMSGWLAVPDAIALHERLGGPALMARNAALAREGAAIVADRLGTEVASGCLPGGSMALARLPSGFGDDMLRFAGVGEIAYDDAELTRALAEARAPRSQPWEALGEVEAFSLVEGAGVARPAGRSGGGCAGGGACGRALGSSVGAALQHAAGLRETGIGAGGDGGGLRRSGC